MILDELGLYIMNNITLLETMLIVIVLIVIVNIVVKAIKARLLKKVKSKKNISNIKIFARILNISLVVLIIGVAFFSYIGSWTGLGIVTGLITAALGFALQRPITGLAAWLMVVIKRPFSIGDRVTIGDITGEVYDITLTHLYLDEIGGTIPDTNLHSGRNIMVPNYLLFEQNIINYTLTNDYILQELDFDVTYESDLDKAMDIAKKAAEKCLKDHVKESKKETTVRVKMASSSINVRVFFYAPVKDVYRISAEITKEIYDRIKKEKSVEFAYPHTEVIFKDKKLFRKK